MPFPTGAPSSVNGYTAVTGPVSASIVNPLEPVLTGEPGRRLSILREAVASDFAMSKDFSDRANEKQRVIHAGNTRINELLRPRTGGSRVDEDHPQVLDAKRSVETASAELARIEDRRMAHSTIAGARGNLLRLIEPWLLVHAGHELTFVERDVKLAKGETIGAAVERLRRRLRELDSDAQRAEASPVPVSEAQPAVSSDLDRLAARGEVDVSDYIELGSGSIRFPMKQVQVMVPIPGQQPVIAHVEVVDVEALFARYLRPTMMAAIDENFSAVADDDNALTTKDRRTKLLEIAADRIEVEMDEGALLFAAFDAGTILTPRADMSPAAFLGVRVGEPKAVEASPASSPQHRSRSLQEEFDAIEKEARRFAASRTHTPPMERTPDGFILPPAGR